jgi:hypothetical protein
MFYISWSAAILPGLQHYYLASIKITVPSVKTISPASKLPGRCQHYLACSKTTDLAGRVVDILPFDSFGAFNSFIFTTSGSSNEL